jgi:ornithine decarboxylase
MSYISARDTIVAFRREPVSPALPSVEQAVRSSQPSEPMYCLRPAVIRDTAARFAQDFRGDTLYAVKCNPEPTVLRAIWDGGVRHFDCASAGEVALVRSMFPDAHIHFMHPVKSRRAIREAYGRFGVRDFVFDSPEELAKIMEETGYPEDLGLVVRIGLPPGGAMYDLSGKFGAGMEETVALLRPAARSS